MLHIKFIYKDRFSHGKWNEQECLCRSVQDCKKFYGLDEGDCEYQIVEVEDVGD